MDSAAAAGEKTKAATIKRQSVKPGDTSTLTFPHKGGLAALDAIRIFP
jgi:hypothetical protein